MLLTKGCTDPWDTKALRGGAGGQFRIPIRGPMEWSSIESFLPDLEDYSFYIADNNWQPQREQIANDANDDTEIDNISELRSLPYTSISFRNCKHAVLVIGGETEGISQEAYQLLAYKRKLWSQIATNANDDLAETTTVSHGNHAIQIPLANGVESLNTSVAASILLFEIRKQMLSL